MKNKQTHRSRSILTLVFAGVFLVGAVAGYTVFHTMLQNDRAELESEYAALAALVAEEASAQGSEALIRALEPEMDALAEHGITRTDLVSFIQRVEELGGISGATIEVTSVEVADGSPAASDTAEQAGEGGSQLTVRFVGEGEWDEVVHLLALTEALPVRKTINSTGLRSVGEEGLWSVSAVVTAPLF